MEISWPINEVTINEDGNKVIHDLKRIMKNKTESWMKVSTQETDRMLVGWDDSAIADSYIQCDDCKHQACYNGSGANNTNFYKCVSCSQEYIVGMKGRRKSKLVRES